MSTKIEKIFAGLLKRNSVSIIETSLNQTFRASKDAVFLFLPDVST